MQLHDNFVAKVVIFFDIHNKLSGNVVFFIFSAEFMKKSLYISKYTTNRPCEAVGVNEANGFLLPIVYSICFMWHFYSNSIMSKYINLVCSSSSFLVNSTNPFFK